MGHLVVPCDFIVMDMEEDPYTPLILGRAVVKNKILKLLKAGIFYSISDSRWVSPIHVVPKKGAVTMVKGSDGNMIPSCATTGWRVCIYYHKLNKATRKDHFPLPFIDQIFERLAHHTFFCF